MYNIRIFNKMTQQERDMFDKKTIQKFEYLKQNFKEQFEKGLISEFEYKRKLKKITL